MSGGGSHRRFGVPLLLMLVEINDAVQAIVGMEGAVAGQCRRVALDAQAQLDH